MKTILITGGNGNLGKEIVARLHQQTDYTVRIMSRKPAPATLKPRTEWVQADFETGEGVENAVKGADIIVNLASDPAKSQKVDVEGTQRLLDLARDAGIQHVIHISIVGIDGFPFTYYQHKLAAEKIIVGSGVPYSILRATQFHTFLDIIMTFLAGPRWLPIMLVPTGLKFQLIDVAEVTDYMMPYILGEPAGYIPEIGGPDILTSEQIARDWLKANQMRRLLLPLPVFGKVFNAFRQGHNTTPERAYGKVTWVTYLQRKYQSQTQSEVQSYSVQTERRLS